MVGSLVVMEKFDYIWRPGLTERIEKEKNEVYQGKERIISLKTIVCCKSNLCIYKIRVELKIMSKSPPPPEFK